MEEGRGQCTWKEIREKRSDGVDGIKNVDELKREIEARGNLLPAPTLS